MKIQSHFTLGVSFVAFIAFSNYASADVSTVVQAWRTSDGWLTELRQHTDGAKVCSSGKAFAEPHQFGLSIVESGPITLVTLVDQKQQPTAGGAMKFTADGRDMGSLATVTDGPAFATSEGESAKTRQLISDLPDNAVSIDVADRHYQADLSGLAKAREQLKICKEQTAQ